MDAWQVRLDAGRARSWMLLPLPSPPPDDSSRNDQTCGGRATDAANLPLHLALDLLLDAFLDASLEVFPRGVDLARHILPRFVDHGLDHRAQAGFASLWYDDERDVDALAKGRPVGRHLPDTIIDTRLR